MTSAAIYARVSSARQKKDQTIGSQTAALRDHAERSRLEVPEEWVFEDEGHSGATLVRPDTRACSLTAAASRAGSRTVNTVPASGTGTRPEAAAWLT